MKRISSYVIKHQLLTCIAKNEIKIAMNKDKGKITLMQINFLFKLSILQKKIIIEIENIFLNKVICQNIKALNSQSITRNVWFLIQLFQHINLFYQFYYRFKLKQIFKSPTELFQLIKNSIKRKITFQDTPVNCQILKSKMSQKAQTFTPIQTSMNSSAKLDQRNSTSILSNGAGPDQSSIQTPSNAESSFMLPGSVKKNQNNPCKKQMASLTKCMEKFNDNFDKCDNFFASLSKCKKENII